MKEKTKVKVIIPDKYVDSCSYNNSIGYVDGYIHDLGYTYAILIIKNKLMKIRMDCLKVIDSDSDNEIKKTITIITNKKGEVLIELHRKLEQDDLRGANLINADLEYGYLRGFDLAGADLTGANLVNAVLRNADLTGADLTGADLIDATLRGADLTGAKLFFTNLQDANLSIANLRMADLRGADLRGADLTGADLIDADYNAKTKFPDGFDPIKNGMILSEEKK